MTNQSQDLAAAHHPDVALAMLAAFVQSAYEAASECESNWQDRQAGRPWTVLAQEIEHAIERARKRM